MGGWTTQQIETRFEGAYRFDLGDYLWQSGQYRARYRDWALGHFFVIGFDGAAVSLGVQVRGCDMQRSSCSIEVRELVMRPPPAWVPWLRAAAAGRGLLQDHIR